MGLRELNYRRVAIVAIVFLLVATSSITHVQAGALVVGSSHLTADELTDGNTKNLTVVGSGQSGYLETDGSPARYVGAQHEVGNASQAFVNLSLTDATATVQVWGYDSSDDAYYELTGERFFSTSGNKTIDFNSRGYTQFKIEVEFESRGSGYEGRLHDEGISFGSSTPSTDASSAEPKNNNVISGTELSIRITDGDFARPQGDKLTVEWYGDGSKIGTTTRTRNGTAEFNWSGVTAGTHDWYVVVSDEYGNSVQSQTFSFSTQSTLYVKDETTLEYIPDTISITARFYTTDGKVYERQDTGNVSIVGIPVDKVYAVELEAENYINRRVIVESFTSQQTVYLLDQNQTTVDEDFQLNDITGNYAPAETRLIIQKPLNTTGTTDFVTVAGGEFGASNSVAATLEKGVTYQLIVKNEDGETRVLGRHSADDSGVEQLTIGDVQIEQPGNSGYFSKAWVEEKESGAKTLRFIFNDSESATEDFHVSIYNRSNHSDVLYEDTVAQPGGEYLLSIPLSESEGNSSWIVSYEAERKGGTIDAKMLTNSQSVYIPVDSGWLHTLSLFFIVIVMTLYSDRIATQGALVVCVFSGLLILIGWANIPVIAWFVAAGIAAFAHAGRQLGGGY